MYTSPNENFKYSYPLNRMCSDSDRLDNTPNQKKRFRCQDEHKQSYDYICMPSMIRVISVRKCQCWYMYCYTVKPKCIDDSYCRKTPVTRTCMMIKSFYKMTQATDVIQLLFKVTITLYLVVKIEPIIALSSLSQYFSIIIQMSSVAKYYIIIVYEQRHFIAVVLIVVSTD